MQINRWHFTAPARCIEPPSRGSPIVCDESQLRQLLLGSFDPSVGTAFSEELDGFAELFAGRFQVASAFEPLGIARVVHGELPSLTVSSIRFDGLSEPVLCLSQMFMSEAQ